VASIRQKIEDACIELVSSRFQRRRNSQCGYLDLVGPYNGEIDQTEGPDDFRRRIRGGFPCVLVTIGSATLSAEATERTRYVRALTLELYIGSDHLRDRESRLRKDESAEQDPNCDPGIYQIVEDLHGIIAGNDFGLECVDYAEPSTEQVLLQEDGFTLWRMQFNIKTDAHVLPRDAGAGQFTEYAIDSDLDNPDSDPDVVTFNPAVEANGDLT
jgi:hypothetical protein